MDSKKKSAKTAYWSRKEMEVGEVFILCVSLHKKNRDRGKEEIRQDRKDNE
jgi:hypothetical protein